MCIRDRSWLDFQNEPLKINTYCFYLWSRPYKIKSDINTCLYHIHRKHEGLLLGKVSKEQTGGVVISNKVITNINAEQRVTNFQGEGHRRLYRARDKENNIQTRRKYVSFNCEITNCAHMCVLKQTSKCPTYFSKSARQLAGNQIIEFLFLL